MEIKNGIGCIDQKGSWQILYTVLLNINNYGNNKYALWQLLYYYIILPVVQIYAWLQLEEIHLFLIYNLLDWMAICTLYVSICTQKNLFIYVIEDICNQEGKI